MQLFHLFFSKSTLSLLPPDSFRVLYPDANGFFHPTEANFEATQKILLRLISNAIFQLTQLNSVKASTPTKIVEQAYLYHSFQQIRHL